MQNNIFELSHWLIHDFPISKCQLHFLRVYKYTLHCKKRSRISFPAEHAIGQSVRSMEAIQRITGHIIQLGSKRGSALVMSCDARRPGEGGIIQTFHILRIKIC